MPGKGETQVHCHAREARVCFASCVPAGRFLNERIPLICEKCAECIAGQ